jgi:cytochrome c biogenesis protein
MRFAISLLAILAIAAMVGTVLKQNQPYPDYIVQFGEFWFALFRDLGLFDVYHSGWFLLIMAFLVISTSLCIYRHTPIMLQEMRTYRESATEQSLRHMRHHAGFKGQRAPAAAVTALGAYLQQAGYRYRTQTRPGERVLLAAKKGSYHRLGYILTHAAIVIICLGGLVDGNVPLQVQELAGIKKIETRDLPVSQIPVASRLPASNPSFRGDVTVPEGSSTDVLFIERGNGYLMQTLPLAVKVRKFHVDYYATGQPKTFASDLLVTDRKTGKTFPASISVNHPLVYKGVSIYQASFGDGGSKLALTGWPLQGGPAAPQKLQGQVQSSTAVMIGKAPYRVEFEDFRLFNVESPGQQTGGVPRSFQALGDVLRAGNGEGQRQLKNVGPSFQYKLRDAHGVAREYQNYMWPMQIGPRKYFLSGMRASPAEAYRYIRLPADENGTLEGYMQFRAAMRDPGLRMQVVQRFAAAALPGGPAQAPLRGQLANTATRLMDLFSRGGYDALTRMVEQSVPAAQQQAVARQSLMILEGAAAEAYKLSRARQGLSPLPADAQAAADFVRDSLNAMSDGLWYGAPVYLQLTSYTPVLASGLEMTRSPGKNIVYLGSLMLVLGILAMFYIRERRLWLLVNHNTGEVLMAMTTNRKTLDFDREFEQTRQDLTQLLEAATAPAREGVPEAVA